MIKTGYYDIHTHILPGVDDGSSDMKETINMLNMAYQQGIRTIIATPHYKAGRSNRPVEELYKLRDEVDKQAKKIDSNFTILLGNELFYTESIIEDLSHKKALTLNGTNYVLVEFEFGETFKAIYRGLGNLIRSGYIPILAHVERYKSINKNIDLINEISELGCYIQMNCNSLKGGLFNTQAATNMKLVNCGLIHFLGSDCHNEKVRIPIMKSVIETLYKKCDKEIVDSIVLDNPLILLDNSTI